MSIQTHFNKFNNVIYITDQSPTYKKAKEKADSILVEIKTKFREAGYPVKSATTQGSFATNTAIRNKEGDYDIDRSIFIDADEAPKDPVEPKELILKVLKDRNFQKPKVKKPCVTADYLSSNLHIDFTIYTEDSGSNHKLAIGKLGSEDKHKEWAASAPKELISWINATDSYGDSPTVAIKQFKRLVRFMKRWRDVTFSEDVKKKVFSIGITVMLKERYSPEYLTDGIGDDLLALKKVVDAMLASNYLKSANENQYRLCVPLPRIPYRDIFQHKVKPFNNLEPGSDLNVGTQFRNKLLDLQGKLGLALETTDEIEQCTILNKVFGDDFVIPEKESTNSSVVKKAAVFSSVGATGTSQGAS